MSLDQPIPVANTSTPIYLLVLEDVTDEGLREAIRGRAQRGLESYGVFLQAHNGRDALRDALDEAIDLVKYLRQALEEAKNNGERSDRRRAYRSAITLMHDVYELHIRR